MSAAAAQRANAPPRAPAEGVTLPAAAQPVAPPPPRAGSAQPRGRQAQRPSKLRATYQAETFRTAMQRIMLPAGDKERLSVPDASRLYRIPRSTLHDAVKALQTKKLGALSGADLSPPPLGRRRRFSSGEERELAAWMQFIGGMNLALQKNQVLDHVGQWMRARAALASPAPPAPVPAVTVPGIASPAAAAAAAAAAPSSSSSSSSSAAAAPGPSSSSAAAAAAIVERQMTELSWTWLRSFLARYGLANALGDVRTDAIRSEAKELAVVRQWLQSAARELESSDFAAVYFADDVTTDVPPAPPPGNAAPGADESIAAAAAHGVANVQLRRRVNARIIGAATVVYAVSTAGDALPPFVVLNGRAAWDDRAGDAATDASQYVAASGYFSDVSARAFFEYFARATKASRTRPVALLLDASLAHALIGNVKALADLGLHVLLFPPRLPHMASVLESAVGTRFAAALQARTRELRLRADPAAAASASVQVDPSQMAPLRRGDVLRAVGEAWADTFSANAVRNAFKSLGFSATGRLSGEKVFAKLAERRGAPVFVAVASGGGGGGGGGGATVAFASELDAQGDALHELGGYGGVSYAPSAAAAVVAPVAAAGASASSSTSATAAGGAAVAAASSTSAAAAGETVTLPTLDPAVERTLPENAKQHISELVAMISHLDGELHKSGVRRPRSGGGGGGGDGDAESLTKRRKRK